MSSHRVCVSLRVRAPKPRVCHWRGLPQPRRVARTPRAVQGMYQPNAVPLAFDVVLFREIGEHDESDDARSPKTSDPHPQWSLGAVVTVDTQTGTVGITLLYEEQETGVWLESHTRGGPRTVKISDLGKIVESDFAQRMSPNRATNPHGEHAEDFWELVLGENEKLPVNVKRKDER